MSPEQRAEALRLADAIDLLTRKFLDNLTCAASAKLLRALAAQPVQADPLTWSSAPRATEWGPQMMEAVVALGRDDTLMLYAHAQSLPLVDAALRALYAGPVAPARVGLTREQIAKALSAAGLKAEDYKDDGDVEAMVRAIEAAHNIPAPKE